MCVCESVCMRVCRWERACLFVGLGLSCGTEDVVFVTVV